MRSSAAGIRTLCVAFALILAATPLAAQDRIAITPVTIVDVADGSLHPRQTVLVEDERIARVGPPGEVIVPDGTAIVDGTGGYLIPGLWDMHAHAAGEGRPESFFPLLLANGITGFRDPFGSADVAIRARAAVEAGELPGPPRIIVAGNLIDGPPGSVPGALIAATPEGGRRLVDSLHTAGAPFIKVYFSLSPETYVAIAEQSLERGVPFVGHVPLLVRAADASRAGHEGRCARLMEEFIENETWHVPTLVSLRGKAFLRELTSEGNPRERYFTPPSRWTSGRPYGFPMTEEQWNILQRQYEAEKELVGIMAAAGVGLLAGSDVATPWAFPGFGLHDELELLVEAGLTPLQALQTATLNPAQFFGRTDELGTISEGKLADLVLLEGNPLDDITNSRRIRAVIADGRLYRRAALDRLLADVESSNRPESDG